MFSRVSRRTPRRHLVGANRAGVAGGADNARTQRAVIANVEAVDCVARESQDWPVAGIERAYPRAAWDFALPGATARHRAGDVVVGLVRPDGQRQLQAGGALVPKEARLHIDGIASLEKAEG